MPAGGLFSTAVDTSLFCRMLLNNGELDGKRYLSEVAVKELSKRQTPALVKESYGLVRSMQDLYYLKMIILRYTIRKIHLLEAIWSIQFGPMSMEYGQE